MTIEVGLDFAWARPSIKAIQGYAIRASDGGTYYPGFVMRYLSNDTTGKTTDRTEVLNYLNHGIDVGFVWEDSTQAALQGWDRGKRDGTKARSQAIAIGVPSGCVIYAAVDFDATPGQQTAINEYLDGFSAGLAGTYGVGVYGGYYVVKRCMEQGHARAGWQTYAWSGGQWYDHAELRQTHNGVSVGGQDCDICERFGQAGLWEFKEGSWGMVTYVRREDAERYNILNLLRGLVGKSKVGDQYAASQLPDAGGSDEGTDTTYMPLLDDLEKMATQVDSLTASVARVEAALVVLTGGQGGTVDVGAVVAQSVRSTIDDYVNKFVAWLKST